MRVASYELKWKIVFLIPELRAYAVQYIVINSLTCRFRALQKYYNLTNFGHLPSSAFTTPELEMG